MKAGKILLAAAFALTLVASANAGIHVWWQGPGIGGPGSTLDLECQTGLRCEWDLTLMISIDGPETVLGWAEDLLVAPGLEGIVTIKNSSLPLSTPWASLSSAGTANTVDYYGVFNLLSGPYGQNAGGYVGGPLTTPLLYITLSVNPMPGPASYYIDILSEGGVPLWVVGGTSYVDFFGANDTITSYSYGEVRTNAAIRIHAIPEPSTVAFLGLGALALIRRRR